MSSTDKVEDITDAVDPKHERQRRLDALVEGLGVATTAKAKPPTVDSRLEALTLLLLTGAERAVSKAASSGDPSQVQTAAKAVAEVRDLLRGSGSASTLAPMTIVVEQDRTVADETHDDPDGSGTTAQPQ